MSRSHEKPVFAPNKLSTRQKVVAGTVATLALAAGVVGASQSDKSADSTNKGDNVTFVCPPASKEITLEPGQGPTNALKEVDPRLLQNPTSPAALAVRERIVAINVAGREFDNSDSEERAERLASISNDIAHALAAGGDVSENTVHDLQLLEQSVYLNGESLRLPEGACDPIVLTKVGSRPSA